MNVTIFINKDAIKLNELFLNFDWSLSHFAHTKNIYTIHVDGHDLPWLVKTYPRKKHAKKECDNLTKLKDIDGVPKILASGISSHFSYNILSKISGIDLVDYIDKYGPFSEKEIKPIVKKLLHILNNIHRLKIIHQDIKPENIIYDTDNHDLFIIDFEGKETTEYSSPEQIRKGLVTTKTDLWSLGITIFTLLTGEFLFINKIEIVRKNITWPKKWSEDLQDFMNCLVERDTDLRYDCEDALNHIWLN